MRLEHKLKKWVEAGLIRSEQSDSILRFEESKKTSYLYYSFIILGVVVIGIGIIAIIAANWEEISDLFKLGAGLGVMSLVAGLAFWKRENPNLLTVFIVLNAILILAMIGLVSQVYHRGGEYYEAATLWCILNFLFLIATDSKTLIHLWIIGFQVAITGWILDQRSGWNMFSYWNHYFYFSTIGFFTIWIGTERFFLESRKGSYFLWAVLFLIAGTSFLGFRGVEYQYDSSPEDLKLIYPMIGFPWLQTLIRLLVFLPGAFLLLSGNQFTKMQKKSLGISFLVFFALYVSGLFLYKVQPSTDRIVGYHFVSLIPACFFVIFWLGIASAFRSHRRIFDLAVAMIGIRFLYFYFDLFGTLTYTGFGLIISGLLIIGFTIGYLKFKGKMRNLLGEQE
ncbi:DUF2157 domain-containing protein [Leptospira sp. WS92.C1]